MVKSSVTTGAVKNAFGAIFGAGCKEEHERLDEVERELDEHPLAVADVDLIVVGKAVRELRSVMRAEKARGANNAKLIRRIDAIGTRIADNLHQRITADMLRRADGAAIADKVLQLLRDVDKVRAERTAERTEAQVLALQEEIASAELQKAAVSMERLQQPERAASAAQAVLDAVESAQIVAPQHPRIVELLLTRCRELGAALARPEAVAGDVRAAEETHAAARRLDDIAGSLATGAGGSPKSAARWEPAATKVDALVRAEAIRVFTAELIAIRAEVVKGDAAFDLAAVARSMATMRPWWLRVAGECEVGERLADACTSVDTRALQAFEKAAASGGAEQVGQLLASAKDYDAQRAGFPGCKAAMGSSLRARLLEVFSDVTRQLDTLDAELTKSAEIDAAAAMMLAQALEALARLWVAATKADERLPGRLARTLGALEARVEAAATAASGGSGGGATDASRAHILLDFAERYDALRPRLTPPEAVAGGELVRRLAPRVCAACLGAAEAEARRAVADGFEAARALDALEACCHPLLRGCVGEPAVRNRLLASAAAAEERIVETFLEAGPLYVVESNRAGGRARADIARRRELRGQAQRLEKLSAEFRPTNGVGSGRCKLADRLEVISQLDVVEVEVLRGGDLDAGTVANALAALGSLCERSSGSAEEVGSRLMVLKSPLQIALVARLMQADTKIVGAAMHCARQADAQYQIGPTASNTQFYQTLKNAKEVKDKLEQLSSELSKGSGGGLKPDVILSAFQGLKPLWPSVADVEEFVVRAQSISAQLEERMTKASEQAVASGNDKHANILLDFARRCDDVREAGEEDPRLSVRVAEVVARGHLAALEEEISKEKEMSPDRVLEILRLLAPVWSEAKNARDFRDRILRAHGMVQRCMLDSVGEARAIVATDKAHSDQWIAALLKYADMYDIAFAEFGLRGLFREAVQNENNRAGPPPPRGSSGPPRAAPPPLGSA